MIAGVLGQQLIPEPQYPSLLGDVAVMGADPHAGPGVSARDDRGLRDGVRVHVAGRDRASLRRELAGKLAAHARATAGHHRELPGERVHSPGTSHCYHRIIRPDWLADCGGGRGFDSGRLVLAGR